MITIGICVAVVAVLSWGDMKFIKKIDEIMKDLNEAD